MTKKFLLKLCRELKQYSTPALNDVLYLQYKGAAAWRRRRWAR